MNREVIDMAYIAGIMDGDGSFSLLKIKTKANPLYFPAIQFVNRSLKVVEFLKTQFGGHIRQKGRTKCKDGEWGRYNYGWHLRSGINVKPALEKMIPYLRIKKERAEFLLEFINGFEFVRGYTMPKEKVAARERMHIKMINFNEHQGFNNIVSAKVAKQCSDDPMFWSYIAGLMDTDGSFSIKKQVKNKGTQVANPRYLPVISLSMTDTRAINYLRANCSVGRLYIPKNASCSNGFHYQFGIYTKIECIAFLMHVIPFMRSKTENAKILLEFCQNSKNTVSCILGIPKEELEYRESMHQQLVHMNKYGVSKSSLIDLKPLPGDAGGNKGQAGNTVQPERSKREELERVCGALNIVETQ